MTQTANKIFMCRVKTPTSATFRSLGKGCECSTVAPSLCLPPSPADGGVPLVHFWLAPAATAQIWGGAL